MTAAMTFAVMVMRNYKTTQSTSNHYFNNSQLVLISGTHPAYPTYQYATIPPRGISFSLFLPSSSAAIIVTFDLFKISTHEVTKDH